MQQQEGYRPLVYVCSPYRGDVAVNVGCARAYCRFVVDHGGIPLAPHIYFTQFMDDSNVYERQLGMRFGNVLMDRCQEVWVFGDLSEGMRAEVERAKKHRKRVKFFRPEDAL